MPTLLDYLTTPNPELDRTNLQAGPNTLSVRSYEVEGVQPWADFTILKILECFGDILLREIPREDLYYPTPIDLHHRKPTDESCVEFILQKHNHTIVDRALQLAMPLLYGRGLRLPISMSKGSLSTLHEDPRLRPDWAGTIHVGDPPYENRVPGDTKQSAKWTSSMKDSDLQNIQDEYWKPLRQGHLYSTRVNSRYGYIVTDLEVLFFRRTKSQDPPEPLSTNRPRRQDLLTHQRITSIASTISGISAMSLDSSGSPYTDEGNPDINEAPLEIAVVPWDNAGPEDLTINLAIWFIHLLATADISVEEHYPILGSWQRIQDLEGRWQYRQEGSGRLAKNPILSEA